MDILAQPLQLFFDERTKITRIEDNRYEVKTPFKDTRQDIILFASIHDGRVRLTDNGYLVSNFLAVPEDSVNGMRIGMGIGIGDGNTPHAPKFEGNEFVAYCDLKDFGESVSMMAHGILILGTAKITACILTRAFSEMMRAETPEPTIIVPPGRRYDA